MLVPKNLRWLPHFLKICASLIINISHSDIGTNIFSKTAICNFGTMQEQYAGQKKVDIVSSKDRTDSSGSLSKAVGTRNTTQKRILVSTKDEM
jgi:hypothetical protein